jgi:transposase
MEFPLTPTGRKELLALYKGCKELKLGNRINMVLLLDEGYTLAQVASILRFDEDTVASWRDRYREAASLADFQRTHYHTPICRLTDEQLEVVRNYILHSYVTKSSQLVAFIEQEYGIRYSPSGIRKLLAKMGFSYKQLNLFPGKVCLTAQSEFIDDYHAIEASLNENDAVMFLDGAHPIHNVRPSKTWSMRGVRDYILSNTGRHRVNINGAYDPHRQLAITSLSATVNADSTIELLEKIKHQCPEMKTIHLIADNARYYRSRLVAQYLDQNPVFKLKFLPPYSPNLNLIDRLWKYMRQTVLDTHYYQTASEFEAALRDFFNNLHLNRHELKSRIGTQLHSLI